MVLVVIIEAPIADRTLAQLGTAGWKSVINS